MSQLTSPCLICLVFLVSQTLGSFYTLDEEDEIAKSLVLGGNYGPIGYEDIIDMRNHRIEELPNIIEEIPPQQKNDVEMDEEEPEGAPQGPKSGFGEIQRFYEANNKKVMTTVGLNMNPTESPQFAEKLKKCAPSLDSCSYYDPQGSCYLECLIAGEKMWDPVADIIHKRIVDLCFPTHTIYMEIFNDNGKGFAHLKTYRKFLEALDITPDKFDRAIPQLANALLVAIIKYGRTNLSPLQRVVAEIETSLGLQEPTPTKWKTVNNPGCRIFESFDATESIVDTFFKEPSTSDILLPGFAMFSTVSKYFSSRITQDMAVLRETFRMFTGTAAGFACSKHVGNCDELGRYPLPGFPIPPPAVESYVSLLNPACSPLPLNKNATGFPVITPKVLVENDEEETKI